MFRTDIKPSHFQERSKGTFPGLLNIRVEDISQGQMIGSMPIQKKIFAPNGFVHAGSLVTFADTIAGFATIAHLPQNALSFTTLELKCNFMRAKREGTLKATAIADHLGKTTQVWHVSISDQSSEKLIARFSCTQLILYPK